MVLVLVRDIDVLACGRPHLGAGAAGAGAGAAAAGGLETATSWKIPGLIEGEKRRTSMQRVVHKRCSQKDLLCMAEQHSSLENAGHAGVSRENLKILENLFCRLSQLVPWQLQAIGIG